MGDEGGGVVRDLWLRNEDRDWAGARRLLADDFQADWPGTRERIACADDYVELNRNYPEGWHLHVLEVMEAGERVVSRVRIDRGEAVFHATSFFTVRGGRLVDAVEYFAEEIEPPYDRSRWAERY